MAESPKQKRVSLDEEQLFHRHIREGGMERDAAEMEVEEEVIPGGSASFSREVTRSES